MDQEVIMHKLSLWIAVLIFLVMLSASLINSNNSAQSSSAPLAASNQPSQPSTAPSEPEPQFQETVNPQEVFGEKQNIDSEAAAVPRTTARADKTSSTEPQIASSAKASDQPTQVSRSNSAQTVVNKYPRLSEPKGIYGQFRYRDLDGGRIEIDPKWVEENIVYVKLPGINRTVPVHRLAKDRFMKAFSTIANGTATVNGRKVALLSLIKSFDGTWVPRYINWNANQGLSNHSWGIAVDINASTHYRYVNPKKEFDDPNLILWQTAFQPAGFKWGNSYSDAMHYELY